MVKMDPNGFRLLQELQVEMAEYAKYLKEQTYNPYSQIEEFAERLNNILMYKI